MGVIWRPCLLTDHLDSNFKQIKNQFSKVDFLFAYRRIILSCKALRLLLSYSVFGSTSYRLRAAYAFTKLIPVFMIYAALEWL